MTARSGVGAEVDHDDHESQPRPQSPSLQLRLFPFLPLASRRRSAGPTTRTESSVAEPSGEHSNKSSFMAEHRRVSSLANPHRTASDSVSHREATVRFREPQDGDIAQPTSTMSSDDEESLASSELSDQSHAVGLQKRRKSTPRKSTRFALAYPAPQLLTKQRSLVQIRPRLLLQLQELGQKRAIPAFDVVPSTLIAGSLIIPKLSKRCPRMFRMKPYMNQNDLLLVRSEHYRLSSSSASSADSSNRTEDSLDDRDVLAVISTSAEQDDNCVEIVFQDGSIWTTSLMANGSYEFTRTNHQGETVKARWVRKTLTGPQTTCTSPAHMPQSPSTLIEYKWTFSIIDPLTRRHPIQGVLTQTTLEIFDTYTAMSASSSIRPYKPLVGHKNSNSLDYSVTPNNIMEDRLKMEVTEDDKKLMLATATWINLRQKGWPWYAAPKLAKTISSCTTATPANTSAAAAKSQPTSPIHASLDASIPLISSADTFPTPASTSPTTTRQKSIRRAVSSSGSEHVARKRREAPDLADLEEAEEEGGRAAKSKQKAQGTTCRLRLRRFTHKLFHPKSQLVL